MIKKFFVFLLSLTICLTPTFTFASAAENWELVEKTYDRSKNVVDVTARKVGQNAANSSVYKVQVPVNASTLGSSVKTLLKGGLAVAAITALVEGVGWIIDEGSKVIKKPVGEPDLPQVSTYWLFSGFPSDYNNYIQYGGATAEKACERIAHFYPHWGGKIVSVDVSANQATCYFNEQKTRYQYVTPRKNEWKDPNYEPQFAPVSDVELGNEVLGKGTEPASKPDPHPGIITDAYNPNNQTEGGKETDTALDAAPPQPDTPPKGDTKPKPNVDTDGDGVPDTYDPEKPSVGEEFELPAFCSWAVTVCTWYTQYKEDAKKVEKHREEQEKPFFQKVKDWLDWTKEEPEKDDSNNDVDVKQPEPFDMSVFSKDRFSVSRQCPVPEQHTISLSGVSVNFAFDLSPICQVLNLAKPALVACSYLYAAYIVIGAARNG